MRFILILLISFLTIVCKAQKSSELDIWLQNNAVSQFDSLLSEGKLGKLTNWLVDKKVVALGEPTHGSREAQLLRLKILHFLVVHRGFKTIAMEAIDNSEVVNDFLVNGKGTAFQAAKSMGMWMLATEETEELLSWMRNYNLHSKEKLRFYGTDLNYKFNFKYLKDSLKAGNSVPIHLIDSIAVLNEKYMGKKDAAPVAQVIRLQNMLKELNEKVKENKSEFEKNASENYYKFLQYALKTYEQALTIQMLGKKAPNYYRDSCMAENVLYISKNFSENGKILYAAHNGHVQYGSQAGSRTAGSFLKASLNNSYYNIGVEFGTPTFRSLVWNSQEKKFKMNVNSIARYKKKSLGDIVQRVNVDKFFIDFLSVEKNNIYKSLFLEPRPTLYVGWLFSPGYENGFYEKKSISKLYDGIYYARESVETKLLRERNKDAN